MRWVLVGSRLVPAGVVRARWRSQEIYLGLGLYETVGCQDGVPLLWQEHRSRLGSSACQLYHRLPLLPSTNALENLLRVSGLGQGAAVVRVVWFPPRRAAVSWALPYPVPSRLRQRGARLAAAFLSPHPLTGHKTVSVGPAQYLHRQALTRGLDGVLFYDRDGTVLETATANVFALLRGELLTPPAPPLALPGVMRAFCLERLRQWGVPVREQPFLLKELLEAEGAFLTSSLAGGVPVREVDGQAIPVGEKLRGLLRQLHLPVPESRAGREA